MSLVGWIVLQFSSSEVWFRFAAVLLSLATIAVMWLSGRVMYSRATATLGAAVFMSSESFLRRATEFLNDVISSGLMLAAMAVIWIHFERAPNRWWLVAAAPLGAGAYYMRYGSALGLVIIAVVAAVVWAGQLKASWKQIATTAGVLLALLVPHFAYSQTLTGSVFGIFEAARTSVGGGGGGLADYLRWLPARLAGPVGTTLLAMAVIYAIGLFIARARGRRDLASEARTVAFLVSTALVVAFALGAFTHGEPRFIYLPLMLMLLTGARAVTLVWALLRRMPRLVIGVAAGLVFVAGFAAATVHMSRAIEGITDSRYVLVEASAVAQSDAAGEACEVRSSYIPQITWYAVCSTYGFTRPIPDGRPAYLMIFENGKRQPVGPALDREIAATEGTPLAVIDDPDDKIGDAAIFEYP
jgi:4-amino-4-deoxy-L-arabinose transferase-like glycosyltransferase